MNFAKKCKELRMKKAVTQEQMATALNLSSQAVSKWENGVTLPDIELLPEISVYFGVTIDELFNMTDEKHLDRIRNMVILQDTIDDNDFDYAHNFLLSHIDTPAMAEVCLELLPALYNRKADEYRRKAEYFAKEALVRFPENHTNHANLNDAQQGMCGDWNLDNHAERIHYYKEFVSQNPNSREGWQWYITELLHVGRCDEAAEALEKMSTYTSNATTSGAVDYRIELNRAKLLWEQGKHSESLAYIDELTTKNADSWLVWNFAGDAFAKACQYDKAIACYERCIEVQPNPRHTDSPMAIAQICEITGDVPKAIQAWKTYISILNNDWNTREGVYIERANKKVQELDTLL